MRVYIELEIDEEVAELLLRNRKRVLPMPAHREAVSSPATEARVQEWMRVHEAAKYAAVSRSTLYEACARRELKHAGIGGAGSLRLRREWLDAWVMGRDAG